MPEAEVISAQIPYTARSPLTIKKGLFFSRPMTHAAVAYNARQQASKMASEPRFSMSPLDFDLLADAAFAVRSRYTPLALLMLAGVCPCPGLASYFEAHLA